MGKKVNAKVIAIVLCLMLGMILLTSKACKRDRPSTYRASSLGISADDFHPSWSPDGTRIVFFSDRDGNYEIYTMNQDGSDQTRLTDNPANDVAPCFSPAGQKIAFVSLRDGNPEIYIMNTDGSNQARLTDNPAGDRDASWSSDGSRIIFASRRDGNVEVYIMNADGTDLTRLTDNPAYDGSPSWSPDDAKIVFVSNRDGNPEIYSMNADGSNQVRLVENPGRDLDPAWSPDGTKIVFVSNRDGNREIYTINADGSNLARLTAEPAKDILPSWSPDSQRIAFVSERDFIHEVYVMDADGSNTVRLTHNAPVNETSGLAPVPPSELDLDKIPYRIVFESYRETDGKKNCEICLINADGSGFVNLTNTAEIDEIYPHASPDGHQICFEEILGEDKESKSRNICIMNIDGTGRTKIAENAYWPCWSGDGRHIAYLPGEYPRFSRSRQANKGLEIYDFETRKAKRHPNDKIIHVAQLCWSPDGEWFVAAGGPITAYKADDKAQMFLQAPGCTPDISPSGNRLAWNGSDFSLNIGTLDFNSPKGNVTDHKMVVACDREHWVYHADWSPCENYFVFSYGLEDEKDPENRPKPWTNICICDLKTGKWTQITTSGIYNEEPDWVPVQVR